MTDGRSPRWPWAVFTIALVAVLVAAASEAVKQWQYKPTLLNGDPVEVVTQIDVNFTLSQ